MAWYKSGKREGVKGYIAFLVGAILVCTVYAWLSGDGPFGWVGLWPMWLFIVLFPILPSITIKGDRCAAGADWVRVRKSWVAIYELRMISMRYYASGAELKLIDSNRRELEADLLILQTNRQVWDLLYNGMLHSAANGAAVSPMAIKTLKLPGFDITSEHAPGDSDSDTTKPN